ncbi:MAG TPA: PIG-L deacetylase family protein [Rubricoccaceae bacterium]|nr:PIG-L deacetylase family protein [Rubricoccaceae bacterium]
MLGLPDMLGRSAEAPLRLLCLGAHADDIEIGCGGTVLRLLAERPHVRVRWVVLSGSGTPRADEAEASAEAFLERAAAAQITVSGFQDGYFPFEGAVIKDAFETELRDFDPHLVFTHAREDRHQDHRLVSDLTWNTFRGGAAIAEYEVPKWDGDLGQPNGYVALDAETAERKAVLLLEHFPTQRTKPWFTEETFRGLMRLRGVEAAARYAEAFTCRKLVW